MSSTTPQQRKGLADETAQERPALSASERVDAAYLRAPNEDDDGYDPYSDRPSTPEPLFERDPWA